MRISVSSLNSALYSNGASRLNGKCSDIASAILGLKYMLRPSCCFDIEHDMDVIAIIYRYNKLLYKLLLFLKFTEITKVYIGLEIIYRS